MADFSFDPGKVVALIPTLMSVVGSVNIARLLKGSPSFPNYSAKRLLFGMSLCEIVSSVAFSAQSLFIPRATSHFLWAIGNGSALGLLMQFSISSYVFSAFLSFVYLSKIGLGYNKKNKNNSSNNHGDSSNHHGQAFVKDRIEPWTGTLGFGYPLVTALIGIGMRIYSQTEFSYADDEASQERQREWSARLGHFLFPGYPITQLIAAISVNSLVIFAFVRAGSTHLPRRTAAASTTVGTPVSTPQSSSNSSHTNSVATAAVLLTYVWTAILRVFESNDIRHSSETGVFSLVLLQAFFLPALSIVNTGAWLRPRLKRVQTLYPFESKLWCVRRALFGDKVRATAGHVRNTEQGFDFSSRRRCRF